VDVLFPALHGQGGEDGSVQGLAWLADLPCVGSGILGSALGMDKVSMKKIALAEGVAVPEFVALTSEEYERDGVDLRDRIRDDLGMPVFVKPSNAGSSVGITKVASPADLDSAIRTASRFDCRIIVERGIDARELEVALLGNDMPEVSVVGEIIPDREFYDYAAKYLSEGSEAVIPADIDPAVAETVRSVGKRMFRALDLAGMARADFLLDRHTGKVYFNEVNTIPGFTPISMYPMLWEASGLPYRELITRLIGLAIERHRRTRVVIESPLPPADHPID
jgi:D-alanine-D-alanine ligase